MMKIVIIIFFPPIVLYFNKAVSSHWYNILKPLILLTAKTPFLVVYFPFLFRSYFPLNDACINWQLVWITALLDSQTGHSKMLGVQVTKHTRREYDKHQMKGTLSSSNGLKCEKTATVKIKMNQKKLRNIIIWVFRKNVLDGKSKINRKKN